MSTRNVEQAGFDAKERDQEGRVPSVRDTTMGRESEGIIDKEGAPVASMTLNEERLSLGKHAVPAGGVDIHKGVESHHVRQEVPVRREELVVDIRPLKGLPPDPNLQIGGEEHIFVPCSREEVVARKVVVPKEEVVVRKQDFMQTVPVEAELRQESAGPAAYTELSEKPKVTTRMENEGIGAGLESRDVRHEPAPSVEGTGAGLVSAKREELASTEKLQGTGTGLERDVKHEEPALSAFERAQGDGTGRESEGMKREDMHAPSAPKGQSIGGEGREEPAPEKKPQGTEAEDAKHEGHAPSAPMQGLGGGLREEPAPAKKPQAEEPDSKKKKKKFSTEKKGPLDHRDVNRDGHVSLGEKVATALGFGYKEHEKHEKHETKAEAGEKGEKEHLTFKEKVNRVLWGPPKEVDWATAAKEQAKATGSVGGATASAEKPASKGTGGENVSAEKPATSGAEKPVEKPAPKAEEAKDLTSAEKPVEKESKDLPREGAAEKPPTTAEAESKDLTREGNVSSAEKPVTSDTEKPTEKLAPKAEEAKDLTSAEKPVEKESKDLPREGAAEKPPTTDTGAALSRQPAERDLGAVPSRTPAEQTAQDSGAAPPPTEQATAKDTTAGLPRQSAEQATEAPEEKEGHSAKEKINQALWGKPKEVDLAAATKAPPTTGLPGTGADMLPDSNEVSQAENAAKKPMDNVSSASRAQEKSEAAKGMASTAGAGMPQEPLVENVSSDVQPITTIHFQHQPTQGAGGPVAGSSGGLAETDQKDKLPSDSSAEKLHPAAMPKDDADLNRKGQGSSPKKEERALADVEQLKREGRVSSPDIVQAATGYTVLGPAHEPRDGHPPFAEKSKDAHAEVHEQREDEGVHMSLAEKLRAKLHIHKHNVKV